MAKSFLAALGMSVGFTLLFFVWLFFATIAMAAESPDEGLRCAPTKIALAGMKKTAEQVHGTPFIVQEAAKVLTFMAIVNKEEPETHYKPDAVVGIQTPQGIMLGLYHERDDIICGPVGLSGETAKRAMESVGLGGEGV